MPASTLRRASVTAAATLAGLGVFAATPAHAESAELSYTCTLLSLPPELDVEDLPEEEREALRDAAEGDLDALESVLDDIDLAEVAGLGLTATFDSAIADGATTAVGSTVELAPLRATITLPAETVAALTGVDLDTAMAAAALYAGIDETGADREAFFEFDKVVLDNGRLNLEGTGEAESFPVPAPGDYTYVGGDLDVFVGDPEGDFAVLECTLDEGQDATIDVITARAAAPAPTTPAPAPVRPDVVQTDAAQPTSPTWLPLAAAGTGSILVIGAASHLLRRRAVRH